MELSRELQSILEKENRWTPMAFTKFDVGFEQLKLSIPLWGSEGSRIYDFSKSKKKERPKSPLGTSISLFGDVTSDEIILLEGEWDLFAAFEAGISNVVTGTNGASGFTEEMAAQLFGKRIIIIYDNDPPGKAGALKAAGLLKACQCTIKIVSLAKKVGTGGDVRDFLAKAAKPKEELYDLIEGIPWQGSDVPRVQKLSEVTAKEVEYIWKPRIARAAVTNVVGQPGVGKSFLMASIASKVSKGEMFNLDLSRFEQGPVLIFNMEDSLESTIKARIAEADGDQSKIFVVNDKVKFDSAGILFVRETISDLKPALVIFDPLTSLLGSDLNMNAANEVRELMEIPITLARDFDLSVVCVMHTNKNEATKDLLNRSLGSVDFIGAVRSVLMVMRHPLEVGVNLVGHIKSNLSAPASTLSYRISEGKRVEFIDSDVRSLQQIIETLEQGQKRKFAREEASEFLTEALNETPEKVTVLLDEAKKNGIAHSTLKRALKDIALRRKISEKGPGKRGHGYWIWYLKRDELKYQNIDHLGLLGLWGLSQKEFEMDDNQDVQEDQDIET